MLLHYIMLFFEGDHLWPRGTTYGAMDGSRGTVRSAADGPGGPSVVAMDGPGGPIIGSSVV